MAVPDSSPDFPDKSSFLFRGRFKTGRASLVPSRNLGKSRLSRSFALPKGGSETRSGSTLGRRTPVTGVHDGFSIHAH